MDEASAAPILDDTERSGIAADHRSMVKFASKDAPGFRTVVAALKRFAKDAPGMVRTRNAQASEMLTSQGWQRASELVRGVEEPDVGKGVNADSDGGDGNARGNVRRDGGLLEEGSRHGRSDMQNEYGSTEDDRKLAV